MGYMSEISLTIRNEDFNVLVDKARQECGETFTTLKFSEIYQNDKYTTIYLDSIRWYYDYPDVAFIESFIQTVPHEFHRLGEDCDDYDHTYKYGGNDEYSDMWKFAKVIRKIDVSEAGEKITLE